MNKHCIIGKVLFFMIALTALFFVMFGSECTGGESQRPLETYSPTVVQNQEDAPPSNYCYENVCDQLADD